MKKNEAKTFLPGMIFSAPVYPVHIRNNLLVPSDIAIQKKDIDKKKDIDNLISLGYNIVSAEEGETIDFFAGKSFFIASRALDPKEIAKKRA